MKFGYVGLCIAMLLTAGCQLTHSGAGSGPIELSPSVQSGFKGYLADNRSTYFAVSTDGQSYGYSVCYAGPDQCTESSGTVALRECRERSRGTPCKLYAMGNYVVWSGAENSSQALETPTAVIGRGPIVLTDNAQKTLNEYMNKETPEYFAVSVNGNSAGYSFCNNHPCLSPGLDVRAVSRCESSSKKKGDSGVCYIYAVGRKVVWEGNAISRTRNAEYDKQDNKSPTIKAYEKFKKERVKKATSQDKVIVTDGPRPTAEQNKLRTPSKMESSSGKSAERRLKDLKSLLERGLITEEDAAKKRKQILEKL